MRFSAKSIKNADRFYRKSIIWSILSKKEAWQRRLFTTLALFFIVLMCRRENGKKKSRLQTKTQ